MAKQNNIILVLLPVYNDWVSAWQLISELDKVFYNDGRRFDVLIIDDGSIENRPLIVPEGLLSLEKMKVLELWSNCGHQRAIALGLSWAVAEGLWERFVVMDSDGEDRPTDVLSLIHEHENTHQPCAVFAQRMLRTEGLVFKGGYHCYRLIHLLLTGIAVRVGNFSVIDSNVAGKIVYMAESWNHYSASIFKSRVPRILVPTNRGNRYAGKSSMNLPALVAHGISALSVHGDKVAVRMGAGTLISCLALCSIAIVFGIFGGINKLALFLVVVALSTLLQTITGVVSLAMITLNGRSQQGFIPGRDYHCLTKSLYTYSN